MVRQTQILTVLKHQVTGLFVFIFQFYIAGQNELCVWKEGLSKLCIKPPHIADEELNIQAFFPWNATPILSQVALGPVWEDIKDSPFVRLNQDTLIFAGGSIPFKFVNGECSWEPVRRRIVYGVQEPADRLGGNTDKFCNLFHGKGLTKQGKDVECKSACPAVIARQERAGFRKTFVTGRAEIALFTKDQDDLFSL